MKMNIVKLKLIIRMLIAGAMLSPLGAAIAVNGVNPTGVNVRSNAPNTVFLTFQGLEPNERAVEAAWCGTVIAGISAGSVSAVDPCVPGTLFGRLPIRFDRSRPSTGIAQTNLTDIMVIPESISRRAVQEGLTGLNSDFFYVRKFSGGSNGDKWVVVTCRLGAGGARTPLSLIDVQVVFADQPDNTRFVSVKPGDRLAPFHALIQHNGTGQIKGRWELVRPGDSEPEVADLVTEASLPLEQRSLQRRYLTIARFSQFASPMGKFRIDGPNPALIDTQVEGGYRILLRVEASDDREANSEIGGGQVARSGGVAGFPMPTLNYFVGNLSGNSRSRTDLSTTNPLLLKVPAPSARQSTSSSLEFEWAQADRAANYRVDFLNGDDVVMSALTQLTRYSPPPHWIKEKLIRAKVWRVTALDVNGRAIFQSEQRAIQISE
jgi:hypothetical protein